MYLDVSLTWLMLFLLGAFHGINPGMGWLFAVGLGLQEQQRAAVWRALLPLALGHALAIVAAIAVAGVFAQMVPLSHLKWGVAGVLLAFGVYRLLQQGHPRYGGMLVKARQLTTWSFLMASAHGAGLMVLPFVFGSGTASSSGAHDHASHMTMTSDAGHMGHTEAVLAALPSEPIVGLLTTAVHTAGYLLLMGLLAVFVYEKLGLRLLRKAWINIDVIWAAALIATALLTVLL